MKKLILVILLIWCISASAQAQLKGGQGITIGVGGVTASGIGIGGSGIDQSDRVVPPGIDTNWIKTNYAGVWFASNTSSLTIQGTDYVIQWNNISTKSPNVYNLYQSVITRRPRLETSQINGYPAVKFDGVDDYLITNDSPAVVSATVIFVIKKRGAGSGALLANGLSSYWLTSPYYQIYAENTKDSIYTFITSTARGMGYHLNASYQIIALVFNSDASTVTCYKNDSAGIARTSVTLTGVNSKLLIGTGNAINFYGNISIADILLDNTAKSLSDINYTFLQLNRKYGIY